MKKLVLISLALGLITSMIFSACSSQTPAPNQAVSPTTSASATPKPTASPAAANVIQLKFATHTPVTHYINKDGLDPWAAEVEKRTSGRVKVTIYPSNQLGKQNETFDMVKKGLADIALIIPAIQPGVIPLDDLFSLPFLITYTPEGRAAGESVFNKYIVPIEFKDMKVLWYHRWEPEEILSAKKPVRKMEDIKGLVMGLQGGKGKIDFIKAVGGSPEVVQVSDIYSDLEKGIIDGMWYPAQTEVSYKLYEVTKYVTMIDSGAGLAVIAMNKDKWNSLPPDVQKILDDLSPWVKNLQAQASDTNTAAALQTCKDKGLEIINLPPDEKARWAKLAPNLESDWAADKDSKGLPGSQMVNEIRQSLSK